LTRYRPDDAHHASAKPAKEASLKLIARNLLAGALALAMAAAAVPSWASDAPDAVGPQDRIRIKVLEWLAAKGEYREWAAIGGEYTVSPDGTIAVPFVGNIKASSLSIDALSNAISEELQRSLSLPIRPAVSLDVVTRAPIYVLGGVETPGKVEFSPGLTAVQAVALAGGFYRGGGGTLRLERDTIGAESDLRLARDTNARLTARVMRLEAELADAEAIPAADAKTGAAVEQFLADERRIFEVRRQTRLSQLESAKNRKQLASDQKEAIEEKAANLDRQIEQTQKQLGEIKKLVDKGLAVATRVYDLERTLSDLEGRRVDLEVARLSSTLAINEAEREQIDIVTTFRNSVVSDLQTARAGVSESAIQIDRSTALLHESTVTAPQVLMDRSSGINVEVHFFVTRRTGGSQATVEIGKDDPIMAGDTLMVQIDVDALTSAEQTNGTP